MKTDFMLKKKNLENICLILSYEDTCKNYCKSVGPSSNSVKKRLAFIPTRYDDYFSTLISIGLCFWPMVL